MISWIKQNILKWTIFVALVGFLAGPFLQNRSTIFLERYFSEDTIKILGCNPVKNSLMVVTSSDGSNTKVHSVNPHIFYTPLTFVIINNSAQVIQNVRIYIGIQNPANNSVLLNKFHTNNRTDGKSYTVKENEDGSFVVDVGSLYSGDFVYVEMASLLPTAAYIDVRAETEKYSRILNPGDCQEYSNTLEAVSPFVFYESDTFGSQPENLPLQIDNIVGPIGPVKFERVFHFNCGDGLKELIVDMNTAGEGIRLCHHVVNYQKN